MQVVTSKQTVATPGALAAIPEVEMMAAVSAHMHGHWGELEEEDQELNQLALADKGRVMSAWEHEGVRFWIITDEGWDITTVLLPEEY
jgi:hypothetical protein